MSRKVIPISVMAQPAGELFGNRFDSYTTEHLFAWLDERLSTFWLSRSFGKHVAGGLMPGGRSIGPFSADSRREALVVLAEAVNAE